MVSCRTFHDEPNPEMTAFVFRETLVSHLLLWGETKADAEEIPKMENLTERMVTKNNGASEDIN